METRTQQKKPEKAKTKHGEKFTEKERQEIALDFMNAGRHHSDHRIYGRK